MVEKIFSNPLISLSTIFLFFILIFIMAKNEYITNIEPINQKKMFLTLYNVQIVNWKNYNQINFIAKSEKILTPFYSNYIYSTNVDIYKHNQNNIIKLSIPSLEIYTNLSYAKTNHIKATIYFKENNKINTNYPVFIYSQDLTIKNKNIVLTQNYIYHRINKNQIRIYYPQIEIQL
ncbi:MAG: hypothetical protein N2169_02825 [bacterium]|nr:hypothetical protein [bacterium]